MSATATTDNAQWSVSLTTTAAGAGRWWRATSTGTDVPIADTPQAVDLLAPLAVPLYYYWTGVDGLIEAPVVQLDAGHAVLSSTLTGVAMPVTVMDARPLSWDGGSVWHNVLGTPAGVVSVIAAPYPTGRLRLYLPTYAARVNLLSLLAGNEPLALRSPCPTAVDDLVILPTRWQDPPVNVDNKGGPAFLEIDYQSLSIVPADYAQPVVWTWGDLEDTYESWGDVEDAYASWAALEAGPP